MLIFGNPVLPTKLTNHLPNIIQGKKDGTIKHEINIESVSTLEKNRCLIVDDEPFNIDALRITLQCATAEVANFNFKNRVDTASNGLKAVEMVKQRYSEGMCFKFIMMDCNMPKMDGYEATRKIREHIQELGKEQPVIVAISGHVEEKYYQRAIDAGMNALVSKPAVVEDIRQHVKGIIF
jgi:CheY-like chemotaxis protein